MKARAEKKSYFSSQHCADRLAVSKVPVADQTFTRYFANVGDLGVGDYISAKIIRFVKSLATTSCGIYGHLSCFVRCRSLMLQLPVLTRPRGELRTSATATPRSRLRDKDVRAAIHRDLIPKLVANSPSRVLDEFSLCNGESRVDVAVINGKVHGVEIKSEADTLERLARQAEVYNRVFDTVTIVCGHNHLELVRGSVPSWWGIHYAAVDEAQCITLVEARAGGVNPSVDPCSLAQFLWKQELVQLLEAAGHSRAAAQRKPCRELWPLLADAYELSELQSAIRDILRRREDWRSDQPQT